MNRNKKIILSIFLVIISVFSLSVPCIAAEINEEETTQHLELATGPVDIADYEPFVFDESDLVNIQFHANIDPNIKPMSFLIYVFDKDDHQYGYYVLERGNRYTAYGAIPKGSGWVIKYVELPVGYEDRLFFTPVTFDALQQDTVVEFNVGDPTQELVTEPLTSEEKQSNEFYSGENVTTPNEEISEDTTEQDVAVSKRNEPVTLPEEIIKPAVITAGVIGTIVVVFFVAVGVFVVFIIRKKRNE